MIEQFDKLVSFPPQPPFMNIVDIQELTLNSGSSAWSTLAAASRWTATALDKTLVWSETGLDPWPINKQYFIAEVANDTDAAFHSSFLMLDVESETQVNAVIVGGTSQINPITVKRYLIDKNSPCEVRHTIHKSTANASLFDFTISELPSDFILIGAKGQHQGDAEFHSTMSGNRTIEEFWHTSTTNFRVRGSNTWDTSKSKLFITQVLCPTGDL